MNDEEKVLAILNKANVEFKNATICKVSSEQKNEYSRLLKNFKDAHNNGKSTAEKGKSLENLVAYLLSISGDIFEVFQNVKTNTNEIDQIVRLAPKGKILLSLNLLNKLYENFICECKNHSRSINVTYVGKLYSLMHSCDIKLSILFSYKGVSGDKWSNSAGLIRKMYIAKDHNGEHDAIIDFNINDFETIENGGNFLDIVENKLASLKFDTDFSTYISTHPAEGKFNL